MVLTAWSAFQNAQWVRERVDLSGQATGAVAEAAELTAGADRDAQWDQSVFAGWATALIEDREVEAAAYRALFRGNARPLLEAWGRSFARDPARALGTDPFTTGVYDVERRRAQAAKARNLATELAASSRNASRIGADYSLLMVFFAGALTLAGLTALFHTRAIRWALLTLASLVVLGGLLVLLRLPVLV